MRTRILIALAALGALLALPAFAGATMAYTTNPTAGSPNRPLIVSDDDGANVRTLNVTGTEPQISPNGQYIAYSYIANKRTWTQELRFVNVATGVMVDTNLVCSGPEWAPNSSAVLCTVARWGTEKQGLLGTGINAVKPDGSSTIILPANGLSVEGYSWSPDSSKVVWDQVAIGTLPTKAVLRSLNADGSGAVVKLGGGVNPVWGPTKIAYQRITSALVSGTQVQRSQIWTLDPVAGASSAAPLTDYRAKGLIEGPFPSKWSPDGTRVVGEVEGEDYTQPVYVNAATGRIRAFGQQGGTVVGISADGTQALVVVTDFGASTQSVWASPLAKESSSLLLKNVGLVSVTANWQP
jgi:Tol biopolymer transport system component